MHLPAPLSRVLPGDIPANPPLISLIVANVITIVLAIVGNWDVATVMFIYWTQSVIIGIFTVFSLLGADTAAIQADLQKPIDERGGQERVSQRFTSFYKCLLAGFFALHYGLFHFGYYEFIMESGIFGTVNLADPGIWLSCALFFANHLYSHLAYQHQGPKDGKYITEQFITPYRRIIPMHMTIIFGAILLIVLQALGITSTLPVLVLFLLIKTYSDVTGHILKHRREEHPEEPAQYF